jgi:hypothetical protein
MHIAYIKAYIKRPYYTEAMEHIPCLRNSLGHTSIKLKKLYVYIVFFCWASVNAMAFTFSILYFRRRRRLFLSLSTLGHSAVLCHGISYYISHPQCLYIIYFYTYMPTFLLLAAADTRRRRCVTLAHRRNNGEIVVSIFTTFNKTVFFYKLSVYLFTYTIFRIYLFVY